MKALTRLISLFLFFILSLNAYAEKVSPESISGATTVNATKAKSLFDKGVLFVDVRSNKDWAAGSISKAIHIELKKDFSASSLGKHAKKDSPVVFYCNGTNCLRSSKASAKAVEWGYSKIFYFRNGFPAWKSAGYATK